MARGSSNSPWYEKHPEMLAASLMAFALSQLLGTISFQQNAVANNWLGLFGHASGWVWLQFLGMASYPALIGLFLFGISLFSSTERLARNIFGITLGLLSLSLLFTIIGTVFPGFEKLVADWSGFSERASTKMYLGGTPMYYLYHTIPYCNLELLLNTAGSTILALTGITTSSLLLFEQEMQDGADWLRDKIKDKKKNKPKPMQFVQPEETKADTAGLLKNLRERFKKKEEEKAEENKVGDKIISPSFESYRAPPLLSQNIELPPSFNNIPESLKDGMDSLLQAPPKQPPVEQKPTLPVEPKEKKIENKLSKYKVPDIDHLNPQKKTDLTNLKKELKQKADLLEETLLSFGIEAKVGEIHAGPTITAFEVHPAVGVKVGRIKTLEHDIALNLEAKSIRIIAPIPGKAAVGIEVPNKIAQEVSFREMLAAYQSHHTHFRIPLLLGKAANGDLIMSDLTKMPHCIIAGATGSGKSVCINSIVMSILMTSRPDEIKLLMIDPKKVELTPYSDLPHMLAPVITEPQSACLALNWLVKEMEKRYEILKLTGQRNIEAFNKRKIDPDFEKSLDVTVPEKMTYYVAIIDELADLMMVASQDIETPIARIAQMARAVGIHLILATQRPSREVITGLIKANFPSRIAFKVASRVNSQIILDEIGAETLLGNGDMLIQLPGSSQIVRAQGAFVRDEEIQKVIDEISRQAPPQYTITSFERLQYEISQAEADKSNAPQDSLFEDAKATVLGTGNASTTFLQRKLKIGYARAASLMDELEGAGIVGPQEGAKPRKIFFPAAKQQEEEISSYTEDLIL